MAKTPLFSTYRQGENRVTSSMLAVFERIDLGVVERLLAAASGESALAFVKFSNQPPGDPRSVADASVSGSFHYLFEVKTTPSALRREQLTAHLRNLEGTFAEERLFVLTPDASLPALVAELDDPRVVWFNFASLVQAIDELLADPEELLSEQTRFLLRELVALFREDGLLSQDDVVVVAARVAYPEYLRYSAYVCQPGRSFRAGLERMGFYTEGAIQPEFPFIRYREDHVTFTEEEAKAREKSRSPAAAEVASVIRRSLAEGIRSDGMTYQVFLLSSPDHEDTLRLDSPVRNTKVDWSGNLFAWTQGQRYTRSDVLRRGPKTTDELDAADR